MRISKIFIFIYAAIKHPIIMLNYLRSFFTIPIHIILFNSFKILFIAICHPLIFFLYWGFEGIIFGDSAMSNISTNVNSINMYLFSFFAVATYAISTMVEFYIGHFIRYNFFNKNIDIKQYINSKADIGYLALSCLSSLNLIMWKNGMEGNIFGFFFFIPMLILSAISAILHIINFIGLVSGEYDLKTDKVA